MASPPRWSPNLYIGVGGEIAEGAAADGGRHRSRRTAIKACTITDTCTKDELYVESWPTDCIHPKKDEEQFEAAPRLYVDPNGCIDCGACVPVCPTNSIFPDDEVPAGKAEFIEKNGAYYAQAGCRVPAFPGERRNQVPGIKRPSHGLCRLFLPAAFSAAA